MALVAGTKCLASRAELIIVAASDFNSSSAK